MKLNKAKVIDLSAFKDNRGFMTIVSKKVDVEVRLECVNELNSKIHNGKMREMIDIRYRLNGTYIPRSIL